MNIIVGKIYFLSIASCPPPYAGRLVLTCMGSCRWNVGMPSLVKYSIKIISDAGLGMAMFSLGMYYVSIIYDKRNIQTFHTFVFTNLVIITCTLQNSYNFHVGHEIYQNCILIKNSVYYYTRLNSHILIHN